MISVDEIYRHTAIDILRETTIFSIEKSKGYSEDTGALNFRNMFYFYLDQYNHNKEVGFKGNSYALRKKKIPRKISEHEPLFDISFEEFEEEQGDEWQIKEGSEAEKTISQMLQNKLETNMNPDFGDVVENKGGYKEGEGVFKMDENVNTGVYPYSDIVSKSSYNPSTKSVSKR
jgi:hypothetical protein